MATDISISLEKNPNENLRFEDNGRVSSELCHIEVKVTPDFFTDTGIVNYILKLKIQTPDLEFENGSSLISESHYNINSERVYSFSFRLFSKVSLEDLKTNNSARLMVQVVNIDTDLKRSRRINWAIR